MEGGRGGGAFSQFGVFFFFFPENDKKHESFVIFREIFSPFFEIKIIELATSRSN
jgi:hypothetical protein